MFVHTCVSMLACFCVNNLKYYSGKFITAIWYVCMYIEMRFWHLARRAKLPEVTQSSWGGILYSWGGVLD